jgi:hypothetical protein
MLHTVNPMAKTRKIKNAAHCKPVEPNKSQRFRNHFYSSLLPRQKIKNAAHCKPVEAHKPEI